MKVAALFVDGQGVYANRPNVDAWPKERDARKCPGPLPAVVHSPCQRWGRFATGGTHPNAPRKTPGDDDGCFEAGLAYVRKWGGVMEHPKDSLAWKAFGLPKPNPRGGWSEPDEYGGRSCCVWQGHYGHFSGKATWLYACKTAFPELVWGKANVPLPADMVAKHGERKARKIGAVAWVGGKDKTRIREATPPAFADLLLGIAATATSGLEAGRDA